MTLLYPSEGYQEYGPKRVVQYCIMAPYSTLHVKNRVSGRHMLRTRVAGCSSYCMYDVDCATDVVELRLANKGEWGREDCTYQYNKKTGKRIE